MKKSCFIVPFLCAAFALAPIVSSAADDAKDAPKAPASERGARGGARANFTPVQLTPEEQTKLRAASRKASQDADVIAAQKAVQEANKKLNEARKAAILKADPSLEEVVKKFGDRPINAGAGQFGNGPRQPGQRPGGEGGPAPEGRRRRGPAPQPPAGDNV